MRKIFKHNLVPEVQIETTSIDGKRYYVLPDGKKFRSVTTVLSDKLDKTALLEWRKRVGEDEANKISTQAARRGTAVHTLCERYVLNEDNYTRDAMPSGLDSFNSIKPILDDRVGTILGIELPLYSVALNTAGRCDLIAEFDGVPSVVDFKTSLKLKKEEWIYSYKLQTACYAMMFSWIYKIDIPQTVVLIAVDHEPPQVFVFKTKDYVEDVLRIFRS